ncbi:DUF4381 domain-containing protein [Carboxylicivirga mesophila]|uniref:DUF4381 domain-containing protein n=1 Tax=Carboxylicivirga mesophila TaxID=1166478 RepID=A0ABS5KC00_9BACT|nr:DUF4381 domain-containing protein [Carboxylicivirga mesophila]MBS2212479.1 DUF4381 domain-containing protein [Carboxylicivirga mesophila]
MNTTDFTHIEIIEPAPIEFTFDAIGWSILLVAVVLMVLVFAMMRIRGYQKNKYRREAINTIINQQFENAEVLIRTLSLVLKTVAISTYGREKVGALSGAHWLNFLIETCPKINRYDMELVVEGTFNLELVREMDAVRQNELKRSVTYWIQHHA